MPIVRELITRLAYALDDSNMTKYEKGLDRIADKAMQVGSRMALFLTAPITAAIGASIMQSSDWDEIYSKFGVVFQGVEERATEMAETLRSKYGMSQKDAYDFIAQTGSILEGFGFKNEEALDFSNQIQIMSADLISFSNSKVGVQGASHAITQALLGEREALKTLGVAILDADVKQRIQQMTAKGVRFESERQAQVLATLSLIQERAKNSVGDYARTYDSFANTLRRTKGHVQDLAVRFGEQAKLLAGPLLAAVGKLIDYFNTLDANTIRVIEVFAGLVAVVGPIMMVVGAVMKLTAFIEGLGIAISVGLWQVTLFIAALVLLALIIEDVWVWIAGGESVLGSLFGSFDNFKLGVIAVFSAIQTYVMDVFNSFIAFAQPIFDALYLLFADWLQYFGYFMQFVGGILSLNGTAIKEGFFGMIRSLAAFLMDFGTFVDTFIKTIVQGILDSIVNMVKDVFGLITKIPGAMKFLGGKIADVGGFLAGAGESATASGVGMAATAADNIKTNTPAYNFSKAAAASSSAQAASTTRSSTYAPVTSMNLNFTQEQNKADADHIAGVVDQRLQMHLSSTADLHGR